MPPPTRALYERLIDYAGVFPPASLEVEAAVHEYRAAVAGPHGWMLGPLLLRASQATELSATGGDALAGIDDRLGLIDDSGADAASLWHRPGAGSLPQPVQVESVVDDPDGLTAEAVKALAGTSPVLYLEGADTERAVDLVAAVAKLRDDRGTGVPPVDVRAKVRTGGPTPAHFPSTDSLARFVIACATHRVPFKATAGLHDPYRHASTVVAGATEHGFVNLLAAARAAVAGEDEAVAAALADLSPEHFDPATGSWQEVGALVPAEELRGLLCSYGSCSFAEPVGHLVRLGVIAEGARS